MPELRISPDLALPLDAATGTFGVLATKGAGKSNAAVVMAEQMYGAGIPWVAIDPKGDWHGVRSSADGKGPGLPIPVFGGRHGDVPLEPTAGYTVGANVGGTFGNILGRLRTLGLIDYPQPGYVVALPVLFLDA